MIRPTSAILLVAILASGAAAEEADPVDQVRLAYQIRMDGDADRALKLLDQVVAAEPANAEAWFELARTEYHRSARSQQLDTAQRAIEKAIELDAENVRYHCLAGWIGVYNLIQKHHEGARDEMLPQMQKATAALERAVELDPDCHEARLLLVSCYGNNPPNLGGDRAKAQAQVEELERRSPVHGAEARCEFSVEDVAGRLELWAGLEKEHGDDPRLHENLAKQYARNGGDLKAATTHADRALALDPARGQVLLDLGVALAFARKPVPAQTLLRRYLAHDPAPPRPLQAYATMLLGRIQKQQGDEEAASASLERARELDSNCWPTMRPPPGHLFDRP